MDIDFTRWRVRTKAGTDAEPSARDSESHHWQFAFTHPELGSLIVNTDGTYMEARTRALASARRWAGGKRYTAALL